MNHYFHIQEFDFAVRVYLSVVYDSQSARGWSLCFFDVGI